ncbi:helix-hairpin-helix domain-containing protein [Arthrobacter sp. ISL-5]|uniref:helix-hairpin-helix domain-containing protein n=1 Tax=Arthrobacter sp. ISL-5 TaxID=2819111 RepID=UPI001BE4EE8C|nr:helix-hairpin-helix domain-containing protein [Arthrobacter sp. ISL-5]MBT2554911.1 helix-hairpin-helix domain-containing protein [Arthrobacter sp. ISL-5]
MSRRIAGAAASTPSRAGAGRRSPERRAADGRAARRLAATLGPPPDAEGGRASGRASPGLLGAGDLNGFTYGNGPGSGPDPGPADGMADARLRWRLGIRAAVLLGVVSLLAAGWFWWRVATAGPEVTPLSAVTSDAAETAPADSPGAGGDGSAAAGDGQAGDAAGTVVVHVAGAVKKAGIVELPRNSRVHQAIAAAGGATPAADLNRLNLASVLEDGQKIYVPGRGEAAPPEAPADALPGAGAGPGSSGDVGGGGGSAPGGKVNLNTAGAEELAELPKVGPVLAQRIVDWRTEHGPFKTAEEVDAVDGVGPKMLETLLPLVTV